MSGKRLVVQRHEPSSKAIGEGYEQAIRRLLASKIPVDPKIVAGIIREMPVIRLELMQLTNALLLHPKVDLRIKVAAGEKAMMMIQTNPAWLTAEEMTASRVAVLQWLGKTDRTLATQKRDALRRFLADCSHPSWCNFNLPYYGGLIIGAYVRQELYDCLYQYSDYPLGWSAIPLLYKAVCYLPPAESRREKWISLGDAWKQGHELHAASTLIHLHLNVDSVRYEMGPWPFTVDGLFWRPGETLYPELAEYYRLK